MIGLSSILSGVQILTIIGFAVTLVRLIINYINANEIDRLLKTPWKEFVDKYVVSSVFSVLILLVIFSENIGSLKNDIINYPISYLILLLVLYTLVTLIIFAFGSLIVYLQNLLWNKKLYYVVDEENLHWIIEKSIDKDRLYISNQNRTKILSSFDSLEIYKEIIPNDKVAKIFGIFDSLKYFKRISNVLFCMIPVLFIIFLVLLTGYIRIILIILLIIFAILYVIFLNGYLDFKNNNSKEISK